MVRVLEADCFPSRPSKGKDFVALALLVALVCCLLGTVFGSIGAAFYNATGADKIFGLTFQQTRPLHTGLVVCWIFLAGVSCLYYFLFTQGAHLGAKFLRLAKVGLFLWFLAGALFVGSLLLNQFSGREYISFHPAVGVVILAGWICLAVNYFKVVGFSWNRQPIYIWMWGVSMFLFIWTFIEAHLYSLSAISSRPLLDMAIQWKSYGALVGSFNLLVYGSLVFVSTKIKNDESSAHSTLTFSLFFVAILNSFTNFGHHTYHLPASPVVKWISFVVSMMEIAIFAKVCWDVVCCRKLWQKAGIYKTSVMLFVFGTVWTWIQLFISILISIPSLNSLIHGTHVVAGHAMGTMIGIDSMILWGVVFFLIANLYPETLSASAAKITQFWVVLANLFLLVFWGAVTTKGLIFGWVRFSGQSHPFFEAYERVFPSVFMLSGLGMTIAIFMIISPALLCLFKGYWAEREAVAADDEPVLGELVEKYEG